MFMYYIDHCLFLLVLYCIPYDMDISNAYLPPLLFQYVQVKERRQMIRQELDNDPLLGVAAEEKLKILLSQANLANHKLPPGTGGGSSSRARAKINNVRETEMRLESEGKVAPSGVGSSSASNDANDATHGLHPAPPRPKMPPPPKPIQAPLPQGVKVSSTFGTTFFLPPEGAIPIQASPASYQASDSTSAAAVVAAANPSAARGGPLKSSFLGKTLSVDEAQPVLHADPHDDDESKKDYRAKSQSREDTAEIKSSFLGKGINISDSKLSMAEAQQDRVDLVDSADPAGKSYPYQNGRKDQSEEKDSSTEADFKDSRSPSERSQGPSEAPGGVLRRTLTAETDGLEELEAGAYSPDSTLGREDMYSGAGEGADEDGDSEEDVQAYGDLVAEEDKELLDKQQRRQMARWNEEHQHSHDQRQKGGKDDDDDEEEEADQSGKHGGSSRNKGNAEGSEAEEDLDAIFTLNRSGREPALHDISDIPSSVYQGGDIDGANPLSTSKPAPLRPPPAQSKPGHNPRSLRHEVNTIDSKDNYYDYEDVAGDDDDDEEDGGGGARKDREGGGSRGGQGGEGGEGYESDGGSFDELRQHRTDQKKLKGLQHFARLHASRNDIAQAERYHEEALELDPTNIVTLEEFALFLHQKKGELARAEAFFNRGLQVCLPGFYLNESVGRMRSRDLTGGDGGGSGCGSGGVGGGGGGGVSIDEQSDALRSSLMPVFAPSSDDPEPNATGDAARPAVGPGGGLPRHSKVAHIVKFIISYAGFLSKAKGDIDGACALYNRGVQVAPSNASLAANYAHFLGQIGDRESTESAMQLFQKALKLAPGNAQYVMWYAQLLKHAGKLGQAELMYKVACDRAKSSGSTHLEAMALCNYATFIFKQRKDSAAARKIFESAMQKYPSHKGLQKNFNILLKSEEKRAARVQQRRQQQQKKKADSDAAAEINTNTTTAAATTATAT